MHQLTVEDFPNIDFGDKRRNGRFVSIINNISSNAEASIPLQNDSWSNTKATYEFYKNEDISLKSLKKVIADYSCSQICGDQVLIAHDFCQISYNNSSAEGLGYLANSEGRGIITYNSIAISPTGMPLALAYQESFVRKLKDLGKAKKRKENDFKDKESYNWYKGIKAVNKQLGKEIHKIHIADREADIYELFFCAYEKNTDLLIRAKHNRALAGESPLWDMIAQQPVAAKAVLDIPDSSWKKRVDIEVEVKYQKVEIMRPQVSKNKYACVPMTAIEIRQISPKKEWQDEPLHWKLLTTMDVTTSEDALQCVRWYCYRWLIERFHYVLKSGTKIEELQLQQASSLQKAIHVYSIAAMRIMQLTYQSRHTPEVSCELVLTKEQWVVLYALIHKKPPLADDPPTLGQAAKWIGRLGGHLGRTADGPPGLKAIWKGYRRLCDATATYLILNTNSG